MEELIQLVRLNLTEKYSGFGWSLEWVILERIVGVDEDYCVGFPDGVATPSLRQCYRWVFGSAERRCCC